MTFPGSFVSGRPGGALRHISLLCLALALAACADRAPEAGARGTVGVVDARRPGDAVFSVRARTLDEGSEPADTLRAERVMGDSVEFAEITTLRAVGDYLLVADRLMGYHLAVVDRRSGEVVSHFGRHGKGPREFSVPHAAFVTSTTPPETWIYDFGNRRYTQVRLTAEVRAEVVKSLSLNVGPSLLEPVWVGGRIVANGLFDGYTLLVMDAEGKPVERLAVEPPYGARDTEHPTGRRLLNRTFLTIDPSGRRLAVAYQFANRIDFFDADGRYRGTASGPRETRVSFRVRNDRFFWEPENQMTYAALHATDQYVYALFSGGTLKDNELPTRIHVFRWNGEFAGELALDRPIWNFTVTPDDTRLYAGTPEPHPAVAEWKLPAWLSRAPSTRVTMR